MPTHADAPQQSKRINWNHFNEQGSILSLHYSNYSESIISFLPLLHHYTFNIMYFFIIIILSYFYYFKCFMSARTSPFHLGELGLGEMGRPQLLDEEKVRGGKRLIAFNNMHPSSSKITTCQNETQIKVEVVVNWSHEWIARSKL